MNFLNSEDAYYVVVFYIAIGSFAVFAVQSLMTFFGGDIHDGAGADFDDLHDHGSPFQYFTLRNFINFLLGFSWTAVALHGVIENKIILTLIATFIGVGLVAMVMFMMKQMHGLAKDNTMKYENAIGKSAEVYLTIPGKNAGKGKIHVSIQNTLRELDAMTEGDSIASGSRVTVVDVVQGSILLVKLN